MAVHVKPMSAAIRAIPPRLRPSAPPIYDSPPTQEDFELATALLAELAEVDPESRAWYGGLRPPRGGD